MKTPAVIATTILLGSILWVPLAQSQDSGARGQIPPQLQTDSQRQAARAGRDIGGTGRSAGSTDELPAATLGGYGVDGRPVRTDVATAAAVDMIDAAAGMATNAILRSKGQPYSLSHPPADQDDDARAEPAWPVDGTAPSGP